MTYSRKIVGWEIWPVESSENASILVRKAVISEKGVRMKTWKYRPDYPYKGFATIENARQWVLKFAHYYNHEHRNSGLNFLTPIQRHTGMDQTVFSNRKAIYEAARKNHPERWSKSIRDWSLEDEVWLNPENDEKNTITESTG